MTGRHDCSSTWIFWTMTIIWMWVKSMAPYLPSNKSAKWVFIHVPGFWDNIDPQHPTSISSDSKFMGYTSQQNAQVGSEPIIAMTDCAP